MRIYFLRHGRSEEQSAWAGDDRLRPLTQEGETLMRQEAEFLRARKLIPDVIVTSPLTRARQTADIVLEVLQVESRLVEDDRLAPGFDRDRLVRVIDAHPDARSIMVVGHEPDLSATVSTVIGGGRIQLKKGGLAHVEIVQRIGDLVYGVLVSLETPRQLVEG
jgi:phosphohistidine phosphatase